MTDIVIIFCSIGIGFACSCYANRQLHTEERLYKDLIVYCHGMINNLSLDRKTIIDYYAFRQDSFDTEFRRLFESYYTANVAKVKIKYKLKKEIAFFFENLSCLNSGSLKKHLELHLALFESEYKRCYSENAQKNSAYLKLGILLGLGVGLLLI